MRLMACAGGEANCEAQERWCLCGVVACWDHGHTAYGDDFYCPYLNLKVYAVDGEAPRPRGIEDVDLSRWVDREGR
jgi:hypothetical protein